MLRAKSKIVGDTTLQRLRTALLASDATTSFGDLKRLLQQPSALVESSPYDARELWEFKVRARHLFSSSVHKLDIDESLGLLRLSVSDPNAAAVARIRARQAGVPDAAVVFDVAPTARSTADLDDRFRPVPGGVRIDPYGGTYCTIGLNALTSGGWAFLTAAHCSGTFGSVDGLEMYQDQQAWGNLIGYELVDPELRPPGTEYCPYYVPSPPDSLAVNGCRYSDAALFTYLAASQPDTLTIARTNNSNGSTTVSSSHPRFRVSGGSLDFPYQGMDVYKIGWVSGWTSGEVDETCVDTFNADDGVIIFCSTWTTMSADGGDSGSAVFTWDGSSTYVEIVGLLWGKGASGGIYSPWIYVSFEIEGDLGESLQIAY